eukprot:TRINITY_DN6879_c0_g1_i3.p1 TRINITY_DN6879_c0_g1~~TRINITY_DN6879_c0_g1_i3.p1  ORF type:complete len:300 (-),score=52.73 TRINITY_DN6879_c0_g1_i3:105-1004(-)
MASAIELQALQSARAAAAPAPAPLALRSMSRRPWPRPSCGHDPSHYGLAAMRFHQSLFRSGVPSSRSLAVLSDRRLVSARPLQPSSRAAAAAAVVAQPAAEEIRVLHIPDWAQKEPRPPFHLRVLGASLLVPLGAGALAVHLLATSDEAEGQEAASEEVYTADYSRLALNWTLHYAGALLSCAGATHWGLQLAEFGVPRRSEFMGLYYLCRFSAPAVFVFFGWVGSVLSTALPMEAAMWLLSGFICLLSCDFLAGFYKVTPAWWFRWRAAFGLSAICSILVLLFSERNLYIGQKPKIRM